MNKQRLSKLQKWILEKIYKQEGLAWYCNHWLREFFKLNGTEKMSNSQRAVISRSIKNMRKKGLIIEDRGVYDLTMAGVQALKANKRGLELRKVSFKGYQINKGEWVKKMFNLNNNNKKP